ncbi:MAG: acyl carrier protein [Bacteroidetes bacterium]|nr:acyl carrier protein [Bacteroidota bacterium]
MDTVVTNQEIFVVLKQFIGEVIGQEFADELDIRPESSFTKDLEMDSIEIVAFSEKVKKRFGAEINFTGWLSGMDIDQLIALTINDIIIFIQECQSLK